MYAFPSLRGVFGSWIYYPALMNFEQINSLVESSKNIRESDKLDDYLQRGLTGNVKNIIEYLNNSNDRFFNSIIIGVFDSVPQWNALDLSSVDILDKDQRKVIEASMGILIFDGREKMFAIDGQHRVEAIKSVYQETGDIEEQVSVIFVSHRDDKLGKSRTRRLFSDINKKSQRVSAGELAIIDEEDIENIVARKIYADYKKIPESSVSLSKTAPISSTESEYFTNLLSIVKVCKILSKASVKKSKLYYSKREISKVYKDVAMFFDVLFIAFPNIKESMNNQALTLELRLDNSNCLMRPVGLEILASVYLACMETGNVKSYVDGLQGIDFSLNSLFFNDIIFVKGKVTPKYKNFSRDLILLSLGVIDKREVSVPEGFDDNLLDKVPS